MLRRELILAAAALPLAGLGRSGHGARLFRLATTAARQVVLVTTIAVRAPRPGLRLRLPLLPLELPEQRPSDLRWQVAGGRAELIAAAGSGPRLLTADLPESPEPLPVVLAQTVQLAPPAAGRPGAVDLAAFLRSSPVFPITAETILWARRFTAGCRDDPSRLHALHLRLRARGEPAATVRRLGLAADSAVRPVARETATRLLVALARAIGIPARAACGLTIEGRPHARGGRLPEWRAEAWGKPAGWRPIDPTELLAPRWIALGCADEFPPPGGHRLDLLAGARLEAPGEAPRRVAPTALAYAVGASR